MKTPKDIKELNINDLDFFEGISLSDAKWKMAKHYYTTDTETLVNLTQAGIPKIPISFYINRLEFDKNIRSSSILDGLNTIDTIVKMYNKGIPLNTLREFSESKPFKKALKFTGKHSILNEILNRDNLRKLQKSWLLANCYCVSPNRRSNNTVKFIENNSWSNDFLASKSIKI